MKFASLISSLLGLCMLLLCGGMATGYATQTPPQGGTGDGAMMASYFNQATIAVMKQVVSIYEIPAPARVAATETAISFSRIPLRLQCGVNPSAAILYVDKDLCNKKRLFSLSSPHPVSRSVDRYIFGLRKIVI